VPPTDIGATLRDARMRLGVDISEIETATKIRAKYLRALENEEWELLPGPTFVKTFLRTYAEYLGLDARMLVNEFKLRYERPSEADLPPIAPLRGDRRGGAGRGAPPGGRGRPRIPRGALLAVIFIALIVALGVLGSIGRDEDGGESSEPARQDASEQERRERAQRQRERRRERERQQTTAKPKNVKLQLVPTGDVWVCLVDSSGDRLLDGQVLASGSPSSTYTSKRFKMTFGNGEVRLKVNGRTTEVPASADPVGYQVDLDGRDELPLAESPSCA
jgi:cytoskeletal protein RodZ